MLRPDPIGFFVRGWTLDERKRLFLKMRIFQLGLSVMVANGHVPSWLDDEAVEALFFEVGEELVVVQQMRREKKH